MTLLTKFAQLPTALVDIICLFTGKFVLDKNNSLRSIVNLYDFENIKTHLNEYSKRGMYFYMNRERLVRMIYKQKQGEMPLEQRVFEELSLAQFANPVRHPSLFLKESPMEEVMIPLPKDTYCESCENKLTSFNFKKYLYLNNDLHGTTIFYQIFTNVRPIRFIQNKCKYCLQSIVMAKDNIVYQPQYKKQDMIPRKQHIHVQKLYNNRRAEQKYNHIRYYKYSK
jgi:hypothetical protein